MVSCRNTKCSETFPSEKKMEVHFSKEHDNSAKEKSICKECGEVIEYYPSAKSGKYCSECQKDRPWDNMNSGENDPELPEIYYQKTYSQDEVTERDAELESIVRGDVSEIEVKKEFKKKV